MKAKDGADGPDHDESWCRGVARALVDWYHRGHRELPWREDRDPYRILVSETMLVQTTVAAAAPFFQRFMTRFPSVETLAEAAEEDVLKCWEGLGYYRRARQLHAAAKRIVLDHGGKLPEDAEGLLALPGVGRYIAGAVRSFAFDHPAPIVEANTQRVLARLLAWREDVARPATQSRFWDAATRLVSNSGEPGVFNQAFMELGATICTPRAPMCLICPVASSCRARALGIQDDLPLKTAKTPPQEVQEACALVARDGRLLMVQRGQGGLWAGFWEFPTTHVAGSDPAARSSLHLEEATLRLSGITIVVGPIVKTLRFGVTRYRVTLAAHTAFDVKGTPSPGSGMASARFVLPDEIQSLVMGSRIRKLADWAVDHELEA